MDLNELPSEDPRCESAVEIMRREREERKLRMVQKRKAEGPAAPASPTRIVDRVKTFRTSAPVLPEGWVECPKSGHTIYGIIPSKVPLGVKFNEVVEAGKRYTPEHVARQMRATGRELGMVIDLTNTTRYYHASDWVNLKQGIKYLKIACRGRNEVPENDKVNEFVYEVMHFFSAQRSVNGRPRNILVHCTHGFNRTGYMIVHYLKRTHPTMTVEQALAEFAAARPPGIYKEHYIDSLFTFYNEAKPESLIAPSTPEWKRVDLNGEANGDDDDDGEGDAGILAAIEGVNEETITNDDVLGDAIPDMQQLEMQRFCYRDLKISPPTGHGHIHFPGSQPVSLSSANLQLLRQRYYYVTWKADGTRYMMYITRDGCYLVDRKFHFRRVQMRFPLKNALSETHHRTLLDGEMVIDEIPETGERKRRYLIYDIMTLNGETLVDFPFHERWAKIYSEVIEPRNQDIRTNSWYCYDMEPFKVRRKDFWLLTATEKLLHQFITKLSHEADGLIFQGWDDPYYVRTNESLLKWKYAHMNSVDFKFQVSEDGTQQLFLIDKNKLWPLEGATVVFPNGEDPRIFSGKIIECAYLPQEGQWEYMRIRTDKETPNAVRTYRKVMESIHDNITEDVLLPEIREVVNLPMYQDRIHRDTKMVQRGDARGTRRH